MATERPRPPQTLLHPATSQGTLPTGLPAPTVLVYPGPHVLRSGLPWASCPLGVRLLLTPALQCLCKS